MFGLIRSEDEDDDAWSLPCISRGGATSSPAEVDLSGPVCWRGAEGPRQEDDAHSTSGLCLDCVPLYDRLRLSWLRCRRRRSNGVSYLEVLRLEPPFQHHMHHWPGCPAPCSTKGCQSGLAFGTTFDPCEPRPVEGPTPFSSVWKSNFGLWPNSLVDFHRLSCSAKATSRTPVLP